MTAYVIPQVGTLREGMQKIDDRTPDENIFVDIKMVPLGEEIMRAALDTLARFIKET